MSISIRLYFHTCPSHHLIKPPTWYPYFHSCPLLTLHTIARVIFRESKAISASVSGGLTCFRLTIPLRTTIIADQHMKRHILVTLKGPQGIKDLRGQDSRESRKRDGEMSQTSGCIFAFKAFASLKAVN